MYSSYGFSPSPAVTGLNEFGRPLSPYAETDYSYFDAINGPVWASTMLSEEEDRLLNSYEWTVTRAISSNTVTETRPFNTSGAPAEVTQTTYYTDGRDPNTAMKIQSQMRPDGTVTFNFYQEDANGVLTNLQTRTGQPNSATNPTNIINGTEADTAYNSMGNVTSATIYVITNGYLGATLSQQTYTYFDPLQKSYQVVDLAGRTNQYYYACCGLASVTNADGVVTSYTHDALKRLVSTTVTLGSASVTTSNILDAAGRALVTQRIGSNGSIITLHQYQYDVLGRVISETNALGGVTTHSYGNYKNGTSVTNTYPDGGTETNIYYSDGRLQSRTGTAVNPVEYFYGVASDGIGDEWPYTLTVKSDADGGTNEWTKTYTDGVGDPFQTVYSAASGAPQSLSYWNNGGQLTNTVDPDGVSTLYAYDAQGRQYVAAVDVEHSGTIDYGGTNRITMTTNDVASDHGFNVNRTQVFAWFTNSNTSSTLVSTMETSTDGLRTWQTVWNNGTAVTRSSVTVYVGGSDRYVTNIAPDTSFSVSHFSYGQLMSLTQCSSNGTQIGQTTYGYDAHGRQNTMTDARNGTTTYTFNNMDQIASVTTPVPGTGQAAQTTTSYFDTMGRNIGTSFPDNTTVTNILLPTGQIALTYGSRTYPVGYSYDLQGRMLAMTNWTSFASGSGSGTRVTTNIYDPYRGWLVNKLLP